MATRKPNAKERILEAAGELFFQRGYSGVGINEIIETAGTAKASFYQHFPSKESLCAAWLRAVHERSKTQQADLLASSEPPGEKMAAYFGQLQEFLVASHFRGCPYSNTGAVSDENCPGIVAEILNHKESTREFLRQLAAQAISAPERAAEIGDRIFILYSGSTSEAQNLKQTWPVRVARDAAIEMLAS